MKNPMLFLKPKYSVVLLIFLFSVSCNKIASLLTFSISNESSFTVNSSSPVNIPFNIATPDVATNSSQEFENNKTHANLVKNIQLSKLALTITNPGDKKFSFLKSIHIYISTNNSNEIELAWLDDIPADAATIDLITTTAKLDEYIKASSYSLRTSVVTREIVTQNIDVKINSKFLVTANL